MSIPVVAEDEPVADKKSVDRFCPEVSYDRFGLFASFLHEYIDEIDRESLYEYHKRTGTLDQLDPKWQWITPLHYTECREYSIFAPFPGSKPSKPQRPGDISPKRRGDVFERDKRTCVYCGRKPPEVVLHVDHRVSVKDGGTDELDNLITACEDCNLGKGASSLPDEKKPPTDSGQL